MLVFYLTGLEALIIAFALGYIGATVRSNRRFVEGDVQGEFDAAKLLPVATFLGLTGEWFSEKGMEDAQKTLKAKFPKKSLSNGPFSDVTVEYMDALFDAKDKTITVYLKVEGDFGDDY